MSVMDVVRGLVSRQFQVPPESLAAETRLRDLGADSYDLVELQPGLLEAFTIEIPEAAAKAMHTIGDIVAYVEQNKDGQPG